MCPSTVPDVAPQKLSMVAAFQSAPALVKILAACLYLEALLKLGQAVAATTGLSDNMSDVMTNAGVVFLALALALTPFLLGSGVIRGAHGMWLLTLILAVVELLFDLRSVLAGVTVGSMTNLVIPVAVLVLLLTLFVRRHRTKG